MTFAANVMGEKSVATAAENSTENPAYTFVYHKIPIILFKRMFWWAYTVFLGSLLLLLGRLTFVIFHFKIYGLGLTIRTA